MAVSINNNSITGTNTNDATAVANDILAGKTAYIGGKKVTGTMPTKAAATITPGTSNQTIAAGQYLSGVQTIAGDADLISANIKAGANIFGVAGNSNVVDTSAGTATAAQILSGQVAFVDGAKVTGTMASKAAATYTPGTANQTISAGQYLAGTQTIAGDADLIASNIKSGVDIFGVVGTYAGGGVKSVQLVRSGDFATGTVSIPTAVVRSNTLMFANVKYGYWDTRPLSFQMSADGTKINRMDGGTTYYSAEFLLIEFTPGVVKSMQVGVTTSSAWSTSSNIATINAVNTSKSIVIGHSFITASSNAELCGQCMLYLSSSTTIGATRSAYRELSYPAYYTVVEFN